MAQDVPSLKAAKPGTLRHGSFPAITAAVELGGAGRIRGILFLNCGLALADVRDHLPEFFATLDPQVRKGADTLDRASPRESRGGIRCETLDWYSQECTTAGFEILRAERPVPLQARRTMVELVNSFPQGPRSGGTWDEVERQFQEERNSWDR